MIMAAGWPFNARGPGWFSRSKALRIAAKFASASDSVATVIIRLQVSTKLLKQNTIHIS
jgi:hypothetical protein